jgi:transcriptional regulator with PAS, ATPase and Fis domain
MENRNRDARARCDAYARLECGTSLAMHRVREAVDRVAAAPRTTVLITGESGAGKELVARAVHARSSRAGKPFVALNCAALADGMLEADLFGYAPGAFTGALPRGREGLLAAAEGGSILFDEIGELDVGLQAKLLRVLQERCYRPVGANEDRPMDVRILAATNRDLAGLVAAGSFREDLFYRLNVMSIRVPALRERTEDVPQLAAHFLREHARELGCTSAGFSVEASAGMQDHSWPGNVRELSNAVERGLLLARGGLIELDHLGLPALAGKPARPVARLLSGTLESTRFGLDLPLEDRTLAGVERALIARVLEETSGNKSRAARLLGVNRATLYNKLRAYGLSA